MQSASTVAVENTEEVNRTVFHVLLAISFSHMLNEMLQSVVPALYSLIKEEFRLSFTDIGLITLVFQLTASLLQPFVGRYTDRNPLPMSLVVGMAFTFAGLVLFSYAANFTMLLFAVGLVGVGSSVFHPESSRVAHMASGGRRGLAQSIFQVGGNTGSAIGPLLAAAVVMPYGMRGVTWVSIGAIVGMVLLYQVGRWYVRHLYLKTAQ